MGLAMVYQIVREYGGHVSVTSEEGKGSRFTVVIPAILSQNDQEPDLVDTRDLPRGEGRILVVDDERAVCTMITASLEKLGYEITALTSSREALERFLQAPETFDLVITDMTMPEMSGDELTRQILNIRGDLPVIITTGYSRRMTPELARRIGARRLITKPIDKKELAETLSRILNPAGPESA